MTTRQNAFIKLTNLSKHETSIPKAIEKSEISYEMATQKLAEAEARFNAAPAGSLEALSAWNDCMMWLEEQMLAE